MPVTPLELRNDIGARHGIELFLKRDDRIDDVGSGHKKRKLDYLSAEVRRQGVDLLLTAGSLPSGQCVAVAAAARAWGIRSHLIYLGDIQQRPSEASGHYLQATALADRVEWFERLPWHGAEAVLERLANEARNAGARPMIVRPGISDGLGTLGSVELGLQIHTQLQGYGEHGRPTHLIALAGSGGTCAGLAAASTLLGAGWSVQGICIGALNEDDTAVTSKAAARLVERLGGDANAGANLRLHRFGWGGAYADPSAFELEGIWRYLREHRLPLDPNYMIKVLLGFEDLAASGSIEVGARVVVIHSGGTVDFLSGTPRARDWFAQRLAEGR